MYAVIRTGGKQYRVEPGFEFLVERLENVEGGQTIRLEDVLLHADGDKISVGKPKLPVVVQCLCLGEQMGPKLRTVKYRRRKNSRRTYGHRQVYTRLSVEKIETQGN